MIRSVHTLLKRGTGGNPRVGLDTVQARCIRLINVSLFPPPICGDREVLSELVKAIAAPYEMSPLYENRRLTVGLVQMRLRQSPAEC